MGCDIFRGVEKFSGGRLRNFRWGGGVNNFHGVEKIQGG